MRKAIRWTGRGTIRGATFTILAAGSLWAQATISPVIPGSLMRGQRSLERVRQALGGTDRWTAIRDWTETFEIIPAQATDGSPLKVINRFVLPNHLRQERVGPSGTFTAYTDGKSGWLATPSGIEGLSESMLKQMQAEVFRQPVALMLADRDPSRTVNAISETLIEVTNANGDSVKIAFNRETGLPARRLYRLASPRGTAVETEEILSDWREVGGVKMPYRWIILENGAKTAEATVSGYKVNSFVTAEELGRRP